MKVLQYAPRFSPLSQTFIYNLVVGLQSAAPQTRVLTLERENAEGRPFHPVDVLDLTNTGRSGRLTPGSSFLRPIFRTKTRIFEGALRAYLEEMRPDVFHAHFATEACAVATACEAAGVPLIVSLRGYDASRVLQERRWQRAYERLFARVSAVVLVSEEMRGRISVYVPEQVPIVTIHAGKRADEYDFIERSGPVRRFLSIGRLVEKKGHLDAIRAVGRARRMGADVSLRIIGDGEDRAELEAFIVKQRLSKYVELVGSLSHDAVKAELDEADGFILASRTPPDGDKEGVPNVLKEAQLMGLPIVSTTHAGIPYVVPEENYQWLAPEGDWQRLGELVYALSKLDGPSIKQCTRLARAHVEEHFSLDGEVRRHLALYEEILS